MEISNRFERLSEEIKTKDINVEVICILILFEVLVLLVQRNSGRSRESERARETEKDLGLYHETNMKRFGQRQKNRGEHVAMGVSRRKLIHSRKSK